MRLKPQRHHQKKKNLKMRRKSMKVVMIQVLTEHAHQSLLMKSPLSLLNQLKLMVMRLKEFPMATLLCPNTSSKILNMIGKMRLRVSTTLQPFSHAN
jgi:hypothetical protein